MDSLAVSGLTYREILLRVLRAAVGIGSLDHYVETDARE